MSTPLAGQVPPGTNNPAAPPVPAASGSAPAPAQPETRTYTQAELDQKFAERVAQERRKYADYDDLKAKAQRLDEFEAQNATELEKAVKKADADARADMSSRANARLVRAEVKAAAATAGFQDPGDAVAQLGDKFSSVAVTDTGDVDEAAVKALVDDLATAKPYLLKASGPAVPAFAPNPGQGHRQTVPASGREAGLAEAQKRFGTKTPA